jgi:hypothetical protein
LWRVIYLGQLFHHKYGLIIFAVTVFILLQLASTHLNLNSSKNKEQVDTIKTKALKFSKKFNSKKTTLINADKNSISITVLNKQNQPIESAAVSLLEYAETKDTASTHESSNIYEGYTDNKGQISFPALEASSYSINVRKEGYIPLKKWLAIRGTQVKITLLRPSAIEGLIISETTGLPIPDAQIIFSSTVFTDKGLSALDEFAYVSTLSSVDGYFKISIPPMTGGLMITANGFVGSYVDINNEDMGQYLEIPLEKGNDIYGSIYLEDIPLKWEELTLNIESENSRASLYVNIKTNEEGEFEASGLPEGPSKLRLVYPGFISNTLRIDQDQNPRGKEIQFLLKRPLSLSGTILTKHRVPITNARVMIYSIPTTTPFEDLSNELYVDGTLSSTHGNWQLEEINPFTNYLLTIKAQGFRPFKKTLSHLEMQKDENLSIVLD